MIRSVFISKTLKDASQLQDYCVNHDITLRAESLIEFNPVTFQVDDSYDVLFFGSKRAVHYFPNASPDINDKKIACVGSQTASKLREKGLKVDFVGEGSDVARIALDFKNWLGDQIVLIPQSNKSLQSIQRPLSPDQVINLVCYNTVLTGHKIGQFDLYIFTSPSNAESFLLSNELNAESIVVAWGSSTRTYLSDRGINATQLNSPNIEAVIELLNSYSTHE